MMICVCIVVNSHHCVLNVVFLVCFVCVIVDVNYFESSIIGVAEVRVKDPPWCAFMWCNIVELVVSERFVPDENEYSASV